MENLLRLIFKSAIFGFGMATGYYLLRYNYTGLSDDLNDYHQVFIKSNPEYNFTKVC
jgi:hypothetical protein